MNDIEKKLKAFNLEDVKLKAAMQCVRMNEEQYLRKPYIVETVVIRNGRSVVTNKEETNV